MNCGTASSGVGHCWGNTVTDPTPLPTPPALWDTVEAGHATHCGLDDGGAAWCWGENLKGTIGDGTEIDRLDPTAVIGGHVFSRITVGDRFVCALDTAGAAWCWGYNEVGVHGNNTFDALAHSTPGPVSGGHTWLQ